MGDGGRELGEHGWREVAASNRERINNLEGEVKRLRDRQHKVEAEVAAVRFYGSQLKDLTEQIRRLAGQVQQLSRRALERPTSGGIGAAAAWVSVAVAVAALIVVAVR